MPAKTYLLMFAALGAAGAIAACMPKQAFGPATAPEAAADPAPLEDRPRNNPLKNAYFGDLHVHTKISVDSFLRRSMLTMTDAYAFAQGQAVTTASGERVQLTRPLDFAAMTDHSEAYQTYDLCVEGTGPASRTAGCKTFKTGPVNWDTLNALGPWRSDENCEGDIENCRKAVKRVWAKVQELAAANNRPGVFTSFIGYEFSASAKPEKGEVSESNGHMHRNVIFGSGNVPDTVFTALDGNQNTYLWEWLEKNCKGDCDVIAIPHNTNLSWGLAFALETVQGEPYTAADWKRRARYERLVEIHQIKGNSECAIGFGTSDEECGFEQLLKPCEKPGQARCVRETSMVRNALQSGMRLSKKFGFNPYKLGFIGSTDTHNAIPGAVKEDRYPGSIGLGDGTPELRLTQQLHRNPGGLAGVWATDNTREALFSSLKARETFGTSGPRIRVRFFGGFDLPDDMHASPDWIAQGYRLGVPMGGDLPRAKAGQSPAFTVWAAWDPESARLQRVQIIKGWYDGKESHEAIYDVACSDGLVADPKTHRCADNGAGVDLSDCSVTPGLGAKTLAATWRDPDFDPAQSAFYYVRVLENPTCRWSTWDSIRIGKPPPPFPSPTQKERAWSSPIWYEPA